MVEIKRLTPLDGAFVEQAAELERKALQTAFSAKQIEESLKTDSFGYFVALEGVLMLPWSLIISPTPA